MPVTTEAGPVHVPVLLKASIDLLEPRPGAVFIDCTLGDGGHTRALLERVRPGGRIVAIDRDAEALERFRQRWPEDEVSLVEGNFADVDEIAARSGIDSADGILFDFGLSSDQLQDPERGFSFLRDGPLDMRYDRSKAPSAKELVNQTPERDLAGYIRRLGDERWAARIASFIVRRRPLSTTSDLRGAVEAAIPRAAWPRDIHPATRTFQALRIAVNDELGSIKRGLQGANRILKPGGRMAAISFHSLEDALVKSYLIAESKDCLCPPQQPVCTCAHRASLRILTRRPVRPTLEELAANPRSRSARLRAAERLGVQASPPSTTQHRARIRNW